MTRDPIVDEIRAIRDAFARENNYDMKQIIGALQRQALPGGARVVSLPANRIRPGAPEQGSPPGRRTG